jgi:hypothetical protein
MPVILATDLIVYFLVAMIIYFVIRRSDGTVACMERAQEEQARHGVHVLPRLHLGVALMDCAGETVLDADSNTRSETSGAVIYSLRR